VASLSVLVAVQRKEDRCGIANIHSLEPMERAQSSGL
jgi:hypothetical protein